MRNLYRYLSLLALIAALLLGRAVADTSNSFIETDLVANKSPLTDNNGIIHTPLHVDTNLKNAWGLTSSSGSPFWVSDNNNGTSTLYNTAGTPLSLVVSIPAPGDPLHASGAPTGTVFNIALGQGAFKISGVKNDGKSTPTTAPAVFLFATEDGTILGWNPGVNPPGFDPAKAGTYAIIAVDKSAIPTAADGAVYKGLAIATDSTSGTTLLYAANFRAGAVEAYDASFSPVPADAFTDTSLSPGYAPFNIVPVHVNGATELFVTYAVQNAAKHDDVAGQGHGIVDTFDLSGNMLARFAQHGQLDSPWGVALAPASFGPFVGGKLLIGNFGNGHINVFDSATGELLDKLRDPDGQAIVIDKLWALRVGNGGNGGDPNKVYFTAGPNGETDGLFGSLAPSP